MKLANGVIMTKFILGILLGGFIVTIDPDIATTVTNLIKELINALQYFNFNNDFHDSLFSNGES